LLPNLNFSASAGHEAEKTHKLFKWRNRIWSLAGAFDWLLFDAGSRRAQKRVEWFVQSTDLLVRQFESGLVDYQEVLASKEAPLLARREVLKESVNLQFATLALMKSLGGSW